MWIFEYFPEISRKICTQDACERYETGSDGNLQSRWRAKSPDALCAVLPYASSGVRETDSPFRILLKSALHIFPHMEQV